MSTQSKVTINNFRKISRFSALYLLAPLLLLLEIPVAVHIAQQPVSGITVHNLIVRMVEQDSPAQQAGVLTGDRILAIDGEPVATMVNYYCQSAGNYNLSTRSYLLQRNEEFVLIDIEPQRPSRQRMIRSYTLSIAGIAFLLMGWFVLAKRDDLVTRYFYWLCVLFAFFLMDIPDWPSESWMTVKEMTRDLAHLLLPVVFLRFLLYFPTRSHLTNDNSRKHRLLWVPFWPLVIASFYAQVAKLDPSTSITVATIQGISTLYMVIWCIAGLAVFGKKAISKSRGIAHHKMRSVLMGLLFGILPFLIGNIMYMLNP
ncbi:PDZ domain-containing protein, partial [bacterium]|nr:PDZ domain-containing protein [bacterium]